MLLVLSVIFLSNRHLREKFQTHGPRRTLTVVNSDQVAVFVVYSVPKHRSACMVLHITPHYRQGTGKHVKGVRGRCHRVWESRDRAGNGMIAIRGKRIA